MTRSHRLFALVASLSLSASFAQAGTPFVPGAGEFLSDCCDNFEDPTWSYTTQAPQEQQRTG